MYLFEFMYMIVLVCFDVHRPFWLHMKNCLVLSLGLGLGLA